MLCNDHNWVHAMLDALYQACVALAKFGRHKDNFTSIKFGHHERKDWSLRKDVDSMGRSMENALTLFG